MFTSPFDGCLQSETEAPASFFSTKAHALWLSLYDYAKFQEKNDLFLYWEV